MFVLKTYMHIFIVVIWKIIRKTYVISILILSSCYRVRSNVVQKLMQTVCIRQISSAIFEQNF